MYYRGADAALICYDVGNAKTFQSVYFWIKEMEKNNDNERENIVMAMAANKCDIDDALKQVPMSTADECSRENNMIYFVACWLCGIDNYRYLQNKIIPQQIL